MNIKKNKGFTLIELIIVVAIIGLLLAAALFVAVDPGRRVGEAQDAQRWADVTAILNAILTYTVDAQALPSAVTTLTVGTLHAIANGDSAISFTGCSQAGGHNFISTISFKGNLVDKYLSTIPLDPINSGATSTGYYIKRSASDRITVGSCMKSGYGTGSIEVQR